MQKYKSFIEEIEILFPDLSKKPRTDITDSKVFITLDDFVKSPHLNFEAKREDLYRLSMMLEKYAVKENVPLLATFETESLYKYVEDRYVEILNNIPKTWIIGGFENPFLIPPKTVPNTAEVLTCIGTNIEKMWIVITRRPEGPFGLVAEDLGDDKFRGFFSTNQEVISQVIRIINSTMRINVDFYKN